MNALSEKVSHVYEMTMKKLTIARGTARGSLFHAGLMFANYTGSWYNTAIIGTHATVGERT